jgi:hypothetical protein
MKRGQLRKVRAEIASLRLRLGSVTARELEAIARWLGRTRFARGKEPTFVRPPWLPLTIPAHKPTLRKGTAKNILDHLEEDADQIEAEIDEDEDADA